MRVKMIRDKLEPTVGAVRPVNSLPGRQLALIAKLHEEVEGIAKDATDPAEYAELLEAMMELMRINKVPWGKVEQAFRERRADQGGLRKGQIWVLDEVVREVPKFLGY